MKKLIFLSALLVFGSWAEAQDKLYHNEFPLGDVTLLDGPLKKARDLNVRTLLQYDCDRLLAPECRHGQHRMPGADGIYDQRIAGMCRRQQQEPS